MNFAVQIYKRIPLKLIDRKYGNYKAKRFIINGTNQNVWIPNKHLTDDGTIKPGENIDYILRKAYYQHKLQYAGIAAGGPTWI